MPVINFKYTELYKQLGKTLNNNDLIDILPMISSDVESYTDEEVKVEFFPNRPDYYSIEGIVRSLKGYLELEIGMPKYDVKETDCTITVDRKLEKIRPYVATCLVKNIEITDEELVNIMEFQEHLHWVIGRDRKKVAIGIHDLDTVEGPFYYKAGKPDEDKFVPLEDTQELTLNEILEKHDKGKKYSKLLSDKEYYPLIVDNNGNIMSMPPIINSDLTKLTTNTRNLFIDVTGTDLNAVTNALNIIASNLAEHEGAIIETMNVQYPYTEDITYPDFEPQVLDVHTSLASQYIGLELTSDEIVKNLEKTRFDAEKIDEEVVRVTVPRYRIDILHEVDVIENIALGYGFQDLPAELPDFATIANPDPKREFDIILQQIMIGLGFTEIKSLMLTSEEQHFTKLGREIVDRVTVAQPITQDRTMIRQSLINSLLEFLQDNKHEELPQKIFEIGDVAYLDENVETKMRTVKKLAGAQISSNANFTTIKSYMESIVNNLGFTMKLDDNEDTLFISGRSANFSVEITDDKIPFSLTGYFGEVHPQVLTNFDLEYPTIMFEIEFIEKNSVVY